VLELLGPVELLGVLELLDVDEPAREEDVLLDGFLSCDDRASSWTDCTADATIAAASRARAARRAESDPVGACRVCGCGASG